MLLKIRTLVLILVSISACAVAQVSERFNFSVGGGVTVPTDRAAERVNTGWNVDFRGGVSLTHQLLADLDFSYVNHRLNDATLAEFGEPNGGVGIWSLTFNPVVRLAPKESKLQPYITAGYGLYHLNFTLSEPTTIPTILCDPFFGCFPGAVTVDQPVASNSTYKGGFNAGGGFDIPIGQSRMKLFTEARYQRMFTTTGEISLIYRLHLVCVGESSKKSKTPD